MAPPNTSGPFTLTAQGIDAVITKTSPGVYTLGSTRDGTFYISRVGRSDVDLNSRLHDYIGEFKEFKAAYMPDAYSAFLAECELWHEYGGTKNPLHPDRAKGKEWKCPRCKVF